MAAEFAVLLEGPRPEPWSAADHDRACGIDGGERPDSHAICGRRGGRTDTPFEVDSGGTQPRAHAAKRKAGIDCRRCRVAKLAIGRMASPVLVAAGEEIEQGGAWYDRHPRCANRKAPALLAQQGLDATSGLDPEGRSA